MSYGSKRLFLIVPLVLGLLLAGCAGHGDQVHKVRMSQMTPAQISHLIETDATAREQDVLTVALARGVLIDDRELVETALAHAACQSACGSPTCEQR